MAGIRSTRASTRAKSSTKWWNVSASKIPADETIHTDYNDEAKTSPCNTKFVTTTDRVPVWVKVCKLRYNEEYGKQSGQKVEWRDGDQADVLIVTETEQKDGKVQESCVLSIHFWRNGTICIQGSAFLEWTDKIFPSLKKKVEETSNGNCQNGGPSQSDADGNKDHDTGSNTFTTPKGKTFLSSETVDTSSETIDHSDETPVKVPVGTPRKTNRFRKAVENFISPFRTPTSTESPLNSSKNVLDFENTPTPSDTVEKSTSHDLITRDIQKHYADLVDLVNTLQVEVKALKDEQGTQKNEFEKKLKAVSGELKKQLEDEQKRHANERKSVNSRHNEEMATLTAKCESLQSLVEKQQEQIAKLQEVTDSIQLSQSISKMRTYAQTVALNPGAHQVSAKNCISKDNGTNNATDDKTMDPGTAHANHTTTQPSTEEADSDVELTQQVPSQEGTQVPTVESKQVRVYTDSIWKAVNVSRMFPNLSTHKDKTSTISDATKKLETIHDPGTSYAILHIGSNDLDNSKHNDSSVQDCLQKTEELVSIAKASFPNATIVLSQVLPRGNDLQSDLNKNIKDYNQSVLQRYKDEEKLLYVRHKKLSTSRHLYRRDGIHLDEVTGTSLLVADVKRTIRSVENKYDPGYSRENWRQPPHSGQDRTHRNRGQDRAQENRGQDRAQQNRGQDRPQQNRGRDGSWPADVNCTSGERSRPNRYRSQVNTPHEDIINLAYKLKELLNNF
ncbi:uncharacterized protein LOC118412085 [Branchiostoma floridae]|uniref:Uncharacterized protein LOC118412085 n=1 Tax=Branchiostoma floridae TaxID=7739 RepID=A0A9J7KUI9_BRAFL|nr:uncharacterized protein LOC118412085 [Branchiostoma floridae]